MTRRSVGFSRRRLLGGLGVGSVGLAALALVGCGDDDDESKPAAAATGAATAFNLVTGWYRGREVKYYDFGMNTKLAGASSAAIGAAPLYAFITGTNADGTPKLVDGQHNIVTLKPGDAGYSDLWQVNMVTVPAGYKADSVKSKADIDKAGYAVTATEMFVNCPIVAAGAKLEGGEKVIQGWLGGREVFYPDFGVNLPVAIPIWAFITGLDDKGMPKFVTDQRNIIDAVPRDAGYSAFWQVNMVTVPDGYKANTLKSAEDVVKSGYKIAPTQLVVNCPVTVA